MACAGASKAGLELAIVVPCYNEQEVLDTTLRELTLLLDRLIAGGKATAQSKIVLVDDGSKDNTWSIIRRWTEADDRVAGIKLSRNRGHQNALLAGLFTATGDAIVTIDADLQDDISAIETMVDELHRGVDVVYGVRRERASDTPFKRLTAESFYMLMRLLGTESIHNHADFRLMSRRAVEALKQFGEINLFLRGIVPLIGLPSSIAYYDRRERFAGTSKYPLRRMLSLALSAITAFSVVPLRVITATGFVMFAVTAILSVWVLGVLLFTSSAVPGWASTVLPTYLLGGIQILSIGVLGEYIGRVYGEVKRRPRYIIEDVLNLK